MLNLFKSLVNPRTVGLLILAVFVFAIGRWTKGCSEPPVVPITDTSHIATTSQLPKETKKRITEQEPDQGLIPRFLTPMKSVEPRGTTIFVVSAESLAVSQLFFAKNLISALHTEGDLIVISAVNFKKNELSETRFPAPDWWHPTQITTDEVGVHFFAESKHPVQWTLWASAERYWLPEPRMTLRLSSGLLFYEKLALEPVIDSQRGLGISLTYHFNP